MRTQNQNRIEPSSELTIKIISVDGAYKALVLDMGLVDGRLKYIGEGATVDEAWADAEGFVKAVWQ